MMAPTVPATAHTLLPLLLLLLLSVSATGSGSNSYASVTALDKYGNSVQLQHARQAATRHGTPMIAAIATDGIVVVSLQNKARPGIVKSSSRLVHSLSFYNDKNSKTATMGIVCTGVKADAKWLIQTLRDYQKRNWETYDLTGLSMKRCQEAMTQMLLSFMGYKRDQELHDGLAVVADKDDRWSRPLGVQSLLMSYGKKSASISLVDPSGAVQEVAAQAIGRDSAEINAKLEESNYDPKTMSLADVQQLLVDTARDVFDLDNENNHMSLDQLVVEVLTQEGIEKRTVASSSSSS